MKPAAKLVVHAMGIALAAAAALGVMAKSTAPPRPAADGPSSSGGGTGDRSAKSRSIQVALLTVTPRRFAETLDATGTLLAQEGVELQAESAGRVVRINFREGAKVRAGELLVKLNDAELQASLQRALRRQELAASRERRLSQLARERLVSQDDYDIARSEMLVQDSEVDLIRAQISRTEIRAPFAGVVGLRYVSEGAFVTATTRVATLQQIDRLKVDFSVPERYASRIAKGQPVTFRVAGSDRPLKGHVYAIDPRVDAGTRTLLVRAQCDNARGFLLPGSFANLSLTVAEMPAALLIPAEAVETDVDGKAVYVVRNGVARRRSVQTGSRTATEVQVVDGLEAGEQIVVSGLQQMTDGAKVKPLGEKGGAAKEPKP